MPVYGVFQNDSFFAKSKLNLKQLMHVIYAFTEDLPNSWVERNVGLSHTTVVDWYSFLREVCMQAIEDGSLETKIGGTGVVVESRRACDSCDNADMGLFSRRDNDWFFKCNKRGIEKQCHWMVSFKTNTFFAKSKLNLKHSIRVIYAFTEDVPHCWVDHNGV